MTSRTTQITVRFSSSFELPGFEEPQPAGEYRVDHDEEQVDGISWVAWRRVGTFLYLPAITTQATTQQMVPIDPDDLDAAPAKDKQKA